MSRRLGTLVGLRAAATAVMAEHDEETTGSNTLDTLINEAMAHCCPDEATLAASEEIATLANAAVVEANNRLQGVTMERDALKALRTEALDAIRDGKAAMVQRDALLAALVKVEAEHDHTDNCDCASDWATKDTTCSCCMRDVEAAIAACRGGA